MKLKTWMKKHQTALMIVGGTIVGGFIGGAVVKRVDYNKTTELFSAMYDDGLFEPDTFFSTWATIDNAEKVFGPLANFDKVFDPYRPSWYSRKGCD